MQSFDTPKHILEHGAKDDYLLDILQEENAHLDDIIENFKVTTDEEADLYRLYNLLKIPESRCLGTLDPTQTRKFYYKALRLRADEIKESNSAVSNVVRTLADRLEIPIKL